jgi:outer membrane receptor protein involved in Fe transport
LGPERTSEYEFGFDGSFLNDRLWLEATYYNAKTTEALFNVRQIPSNGFIDINGTSAQLENIGTIKNAGFEFAVNGTIVEGNTWTWDLGGTLFTNKSEVGLPEDLAEISLGGNGWIVDGEPVPVIRGECVTNPTEFAEPDIIDDCIYGPNSPTLGFGINTNVNLPGGFVLSARGEYQGGHFVTATVANSAVSRSVSWAGCYDEYSIEEDGGRDALTALQRARCDADLTDSNFWAEKADFFKIREISLQYQLPPSMLMGADAASLTLSGRNLYRWTNSEWTHFDPEMGGNNDNNAISRDGEDPGAFLVTSINEHIPAPAIWTVALRVVF